MPTDEFRPMLERAEVVREAQPIIEVACPLLRELVNASGAAFQRCQGAPITGVASMKTWLQRSSTGT